MEKTLFDKNGKAVAYIHMDYNNTVYLWEGYPVAYLHNEKHIYGNNGRHLGWFINGVLYNNAGERIGFTSETCPVAITKEPVKTERRSMDNIRSRWKAPPSPRLSFNLATQELREFLKEGEMVLFSDESH